MNLHVLATYYYNSNYRNPGYFVSNDAMIEGLSMIVNLAFAFAIVATLLALVKAAICNEDVSKEKRNQRAAAALQELKCGNLDKGAWALALIRTGWNEESARLEYVKLRRDVDDDEDEY